MTLEGRTVGSLVAQHRLAGRPRARRPVGAADPGQPGGGLAAHLGAVPGRPRPAPPRPAPVRRGDRPGPQPRGPDRRAAPGRGAAAARPPARADRRRAAPDRPRAARQRHAVRPLRRHGRRDRPRRRRGARRARRPRSWTGSTTAKKLSQDAVEQLRRAIYALHQPHRDTVSTLPELLHEVAHQHKPHLHVQLRVEGDVVRLPNDADHEIARTVGEALFNVATHAQATRAIVRLRYRPDRITVSVADDGDGRPDRAEPQAAARAGHHGRRPAPRPGQHGEPDQRPRRQPRVPAGPARRRPRRDAHPAAAAPGPRPGHRPGRRPPSTDAPAHTHDQMEA